MTESESGSLLDFLVAELLAERRHKVPQLGGRDEAVAVLYHVKLNFSEMKCYFEYFTPFLKTRQKRGLDRGGTEQETICISGATNYAA